MATAELESKTSSIADRVLSRSREYGLANPKPEWKIDYGPGVVVANTDTPITFGTDTAITVNSGYNYNIPEPTSTAVEYNPNPLAGTYTGTGIDTRGLVGSPMTSQLLADINQKVNTDNVKASYDFSDNSIVFTGTNSVTMGKQYLETILRWNGTGDGWTVGTIDNITIKNCTIGDSFTGKEIQKELKRQQIRNKYKINVISRGSLIKGIPENEQIAIETLREEIMESEFRKYIAYGFINVRGESGKTYQVFRNDNHVKVWKGGILLEEICIYVQDNSIPPTDRVIGIKAMIEADEEEFKTFGNVYVMQKAA